MSRLVSRLPRVRLGRGAIVLTAGVVIAAVVAPFALGANGAVVKAGRSTQSTTETDILANSTTWLTRQSNFNKTSGGAAAYGCRAPAGTRPCIFGFNLVSGLAFEFRTRGNSAGYIQVDPTPPQTSATVAPFTTNAHGVATGLNSDMLDGKHATDFAPATAIRSLGLVKLSGGTATKPLLTVGDITLTGDCIQVSPTTLTADIMAKSSATGASVAAGASSIPDLSGGAPTPLATITGSSGAPDFGSNSVQIVGPDGTLLSGSVFVGIDTQNPNNCAIGGTLTQG